MIEQYSLTRSFQHHPANLRGSVFMCRIEELNAIYPCALMSEFPLGRILRRLKLPVIPVSYNLDQPGAVICREKSLRFAVVTTRARTIDASAVDLERHIAQMSYRSINNVSKGLINTFHLMPAMSRPIWNPPGTRLYVPRKNASGADHVAVIGLAHVFSREVPLLVTPIDDFEKIGSTKEIDIYPLKQNDALQAVFGGSLSMSRLIKLQRAALTTYGL